MLRFCLKTTSISHGDLSKKASAASDHMLHQYQSPYPPEHNTIVPYLLPQAK